MKFKLVENILLEGKNIDQLFNQYKNKIINKFFELYGDNFFSSEQQRREWQAEHHWTLDVLSLDPTFDKAPDGKSGDFGEWLTRMWLSDSFRDTVQEGLITDILQRFIKVRPNFTNPRERDINFYKSFNELKEKVENSDLSARQKDRQMRRNFKDATLVYQDENWQVWVPQNHSAACSLGAGSGWCTADTRSNYHYKHYLRYGGEYYILISKFEPQEKYQLHFESEQFMGAGTNPGHELNEEYVVNYDEFMSKYPKVKQFFENTEKKEFKGLWKQIVDNYFSEQDGDKVYGLLSLSKVFDYFNSHGTQALKNFIETITSDEVFTDIKNKIGTQCIDGIMLFLEQSGIKEKYSDYFDNLDDIQDCIESAINDYISTNQLIQKKIISHSLSPTFSINNELDSLVVDVDKNTAYSVVDVEIEHIVEDYDSYWQDSDEDDDYVSVVSEDEIIENLYEQRFGYDVKKAFDEDDVLLLTSGGLNDLDNFIKYDLDDYFYGIEYIPCNQQTGPELLKWLELEIKAKYDIR